MCSALPVCQRKSYGECAVLLLLLYFSCSHFVVVPVFASRLLRFLAVLSSLIVFYVMCCVFAPSLCCDGYLMISCTFRLFDSSVSFVYAQMQRLSQSKRQSYQLLRCFCSVSRCTLQSGGRLRSAAPSRR